jgi:hypothetical protein
MVTNDLNGTSKSVSEKKLISLCAAFFATVFLVLAVMPGTSEAAGMGVASREMRLSLNPGFFHDREAGYQQYWTIVKTVATESSVGDENEKNAFEESVRQIKYYDTNNKDLAKQNYILRERTKIKNGVLDSKTELTLKYRIADGEPAAGNILETGSKYKSEIKCEEDYSGFADGVVGKFSSKVSVSNTVKKLPCVERTVLGDYAEIYPALGELRLDLSEPVYFVNEVSVKEYKVTPGTLDFCGTKVEVDICVWIDETTDKLITAEISWKHDAEVSAAAREKMDSFFIALQAKAPEWLVAGGTKTQLVSQ